MVHAFIQSNEKSHLNGRMNVSADIEEVDAETNVEHNKVLS